MAAQVAQMEKHVLVVDDDPLIRDALTMLLEGEGYQVSVAANGQEALRHLHESEAELPSLILLDLMMPVVDGWQFLSARRKDPALAHIPVVVISANGSGMQSTACLGADSYLQKPVGLEDLLDVLGRYC